MEEQLISYETAILAKNKGFDEVTDKIYTRTHDVVHPLRENMNGLRHSDGENYFVSAPTQSFVQKWLRETHGIEMWCSVINDNVLKDIEEKGKYCISLYKEEWNPRIPVNKNSRGFSYEECLEKALVTALNLL